MLFKIATYLSLIVLSFFVFGDVTFACDYVVGQGEEFTNIQDAINTAKNNNPAGKEVCIKNNKEYITDRIVVSASGTKSNPFVIKKHPQSNGRPVIRDNSPYDANITHQALFIVTGSNVVVEGLEISRTTGIAFTSKNGATNNVFRDNVTHNIFTVAYKIIDSPGTVVDKCLVYEAGISDSDACKAVPSCNVWPDNHPEIVNISASYDNEITNCTIYNVYGGTISSVRSYNTRIANNHIYDTKRSLIHLDQAKKIVVENNIVYNTFTHPEVWIREPEDGFYKLDEYYDGSRQFYTFPSPIGRTDFTKPFGQDRIIRNNIFINTAIGLNFGKCEDANQNPQPDNCYLKNDIIKNNTILNSSERAIRLSGHEFSENNTVSNNLFHYSGNDSIAVNEGVSGGFTFLDNVWSKTPPNFFSSNSDVIKGDNEVKNMFVDPSKILNNNVIKPGQVQASWFKLKPEFSQYGANADLVGPDSSGIVPTPDVSPTPIYDPKFDINDSGEVDIVDVIDFIKYLFR